MISISLHPESPPPAQGVQVLLTERKRNAGEQLAREIDMGVKYTYI